MRELWADFKKFIMRGNVLDLAVAVVIGVAFNAIVQSFVNDLMMPVVAALFGKPDFSDLTFTINDAVFRYGAFITALINFLIIAASVFLVVKVFEKLSSLRKGSLEDEAEPLTLDQELLSEIRDLLRARN